MFVLSVTSISAIPRNPAIESTMAIAPPAADKIKGLAFGFTFKTIDLFYV
jgi:hypothetical protein